MSIKFAHFLNDFKASCRMKMKCSCDNMVTLVNVPSLIRETGAFLSEWSLVGLLIQQPQCLGKGCLNQGSNKNKRHAQIELLGGH